MLKIYNTLTQKKETFVTLTPGQVKMYVCGPTVYSYLHIGNFRPIIFFNMVRSWLERVGYQVTYVSNITDIDDKIIKAAQEEKVSLQVVTDKYIAAYQEDLARLKIRLPDHTPKVTEHLPQIISLIEELLRKQKAYIGESGDLLYSVRSFADYGKLSHKNIDQLQSGARVEIDERKRDPLDFVLWKKAKPNEPEWPSPWGPGRPGWHIECSAMANHFLGASMDIHGGGIDLTFPHHENEIAQSEGALERPFVSFFMHNHFINMGAIKMSKSLGNILTGRVFLDQYNSEILKFLILSTHYRSQIDFSPTQIEQSIAALARIYSALARGESQATQTESSTPHDQEFASKLTSATEAINEAMADDFGTPEVFARIFEIVRIFNQLCPPQMLSKKDTGLLLYRWLVDLGKPLALFQERPKEFLIVLDDMLLKQRGLQRKDIDRIVESRREARARKDFGAADNFRKELTDLGIEVHDSPQGTHWEVKK